MEPKTISFDASSQSNPKLSQTTIRLRRGFTFGLVLLVAITGYSLGLVALNWLLGHVLDRDFVLIAASGVSALLVGLGFAPLHQRLQTLSLLQLEADSPVGNSKDTLTDIDIVFAPDLSGQRIGAYELQEVIGRGGMAEVYQAVGHEAIVAIKVLHAHYLADDENLKRFYREGEIGLGVNNPHIAAVYEIGKHQNMPYIVMEFVDGADLREIVQRMEDYSVDDVVLWMQDICKALDTAHSQGYIHRDIKPSNIMIRPNGEAVLMDFGIAKLQHATTRLTGSSVGTLDYMAPEQIVDSRSIDHRADIYTLGIVCYELLTGFLPFAGGIAQIMYAHIHHAPPDPRGLAPTLPAHIADAIMKAMAKDPNDRFQTAGEFAAALKG